MQKNKKKANLTPLFLILPVVIWLSFFLIAPYGVMFDLSLRDSDDRSFTTYANPIYANYDKFISQPPYPTVLLNSIIYAGISTFIVILICYPFAYFAARGKWGKYILFVVFIPYLAPYLVRIFSWRVILGRSGIVNQFLMFTGITDAPLSWILFSKVSLVIGMVYLFLPVMTIPVYLSLKRIDKFLIEASQDLGAGVWRTFRYVIFPLSKPGLLVGFLLTFVPLTLEFLTPALLGGTDTGLLMGDVIFTYFTTGQNKPVAASISYVMMAATVILMFMVIRSAGIQKVFGGQGRN